MQKIHPEPQPSKNTLINLKAEQLVGHLSPEFLLKHVK